METSQSIGKLTEALAKAQNAFPKIEKGKVADLKTYKYAYADLGDVINTVKESLAKNGIAVTQAFLVLDGKQALGTVLMHSSGEWVKSTLLMLPARDPQEMGSLITYYRRYALCAILGVAAEDDDDGVIAKNAGAAAKVERIQASVNKSKPSGDNSYLDAPTCCGKRMMDSKYPKSGNPEWYCMTCKKSELKAM